MHKQLKLNVVAIYKQLNEMYAFLRSSAKSQTKCLGRRVKPIILFVIMGLQGVSELGNSNHELRVKPNPCIHIFIDFPKMAFKELSTIC